MPTERLRPPSPLALAWRQTLRDVRAGQLRLLALAVVLAVGALTAVGFFADRLNGALVRDARQLLGGDAIVGSDRPAPVAFDQRALQLGLHTARMASFPSMARTGNSAQGATQLVALKAVSPGYPLRGRMVLKASEEGPEQAMARAPQPGMAWADAAVLEALNLKLGQPILLGDASLTLERIIVAEPDRGAGFMNFAPRVMINEADLPATGLVQPASRINYRLAVSAPDGAAAAVAEWVRWAQATIQEGQLRGVRLETMDAGRPEMRQTLDRAQKFLNLVALLAALLAAVAVAIAARDFADSHLNDCAMLRVLGLAQWRIAAAYSLQFAGLGLVASVVGVAVGLGLHEVFVWLLRGLLQTDLPPPSGWPALFGLGVGMTLMMGFGLAPVLQLARVPALRVMRRDVGTPKAASVGVLAAGASGFSALLLAVAADWKLGLIAVGGFAAAIAVFALASWLAVVGLKRAVPESRAPRWLVLATRQIAARPAFAVLQVSALAVGLLAIILLVLLRTDLIASWRQSTPADAPNRFVINVLPEQAEAFKKTLQERGVPKFDFYPMIRGRLVAINGQAVQPQSFADERARRLVEREFNLSHDAQQPEHNVITAGQWRAEETGAVSVEEGLATTLGLKLGDALRFDIGGQTQEGRITSLRKVDWGSMRVNFFVMFPVSSMPSVPLTYISAFRSPGVKGFDNSLAHDFPNITNLDVSSQIAQVQAVVGQVIQAVEFLFAFTLATGLVVLFAAVSATRDARAHEFALMRALGASSALLSRVQRAELAGVGALAGTLAALAAMAVGWALARFAFEFNWQPLWWVPLAGAAAGALLALAAGWWSLRSVLRTPVVQTLRQAAT